jgi:hypothetical protein
MAGKRRASTRAQAASVGWRNFKGFFSESLTSTDLLQCKQCQGEALRDYFKRFVQVKAKVADVLEEVAIEAAIKGLRIGPFAAHLA